MPREAIAAAAVHEVLPLKRIAEQLMRHLRENAGANLHRV
jgi:two-component system chemotaxis response regulator CheB